MDHPASLGHVVHNMDLDNDEDVDLIRQSLFQNGVIVLRASPPYILSRQDQLRFTGKMGNIIRLPEAFGGEVRPEAKERGIWAKMRRRRRR